MGPHLPLVGMAKEIERLNLALEAGDPLLLLGPQGSGKTRLITEALRLHRHVLYVGWQPTLHSLLVAMARALIAARHAGFLRRTGAPLRPSDAEGWLAVQTSIHLKGLLWAALEGSPVPIVLDGIAGAGFATYRFLQRICHAPGMALFAVSRDAFSLGPLARLFWNPAKMLNLPPLAEQDAESLFEAAAGRFKLHHMDLDEFREKALESARGNPGQIIEMCRLAAQPQYHAGRYIKFSAVRIDTVMKFAP